MRGLAGKRIVNTRAAHQASEFDALLERHGAIPLDYPCIAIVASKDTILLDQALRDPFDLLVLTSANTVTILAQRAKALGISLTGVKAVAVGTSTAEAARAQLGVEITVVPDEFTAERLDSQLTIHPGMRILLPQSEIARTALSDSLRERGAQVIAVTTYRTVRGYGGVEPAPLLKARQVDAVTFTSSSTAQFFVERLNEEGGEICDLEGVCIACIGPQTSQTARDCGLTVDVEPKTHTLAGLVESLATYFEEPS